MIFADLFDTAMSIRPTRLGGAGPRVLTALLGLGALVVLGLGAAGIAAAQGTAWKWRDTQGRIQYSDRPPPAQVSDRDILQKPSARPTSRVEAPAAEASGSAQAASAPGPRASGTAPGGQDPALEARRRQAAAVETDKRKAEEQLRKQIQAENCQKTREYLKHMQDGMRVARLNAQGAREYLSESERAQEMSRAGEMISAECAP